MYLNLSRPSLSGNIDVTLKGENDKILHEEKNIDIEHEVEIPDDQNKELTLEITYTSKLIFSKKDKFKYFSAVFWYHLFPLIFRDNDLYKYGAVLYVKKTFHIGSLKTDAYMEYEPYHKNEMIYDNGEFVKIKEEVEYKYRYLSYIARACDILVYVLLIALAIFLNYLWIKEIV